MNNERIISWLDVIFADLPQTNNVQKQKDELSVRLTEQVKEYMAEGKDYNQAFEAAKLDLGDVNELLENLQDRSNGNDWGKMIRDEDENQAQAHAQAQDGWDEDDDWDKDDAWNENEKHWNWNWDRDWGNIWQKPSARLVALSPFIYVGLGFLFDWWAWAWVIVPLSAVLFGAPIPYGQRLVAASPFIYVLMGFFFGWWAWGLAHNPSKRNFIRH